MTSNPGASVGILVAGMHRSGTSATTRTINLLGADVGFGLMPPHADNPTGFWELLAVAHAQDRLLADLGSAWHDTRPLPAGWPDGEAAARAREELLDILGREFAASRVFVVKDPRASRLLPLWMEVFDRLAITPVVVVVARDPSEVAGSLHARDGFPASKSWLLYARTYLEAERATRGQRRAFVDYERLLSDWRPFARRLAELVAPACLPGDDDAAARIDRFLDGALRHQRSGDDEPAAGEGPPRLVLEIYRVMRAAAGTSDEGALRDTFDRVAARLDEATPLYQGTEAERAEARARARQLRDERLVLPEPREVERLKSDLAVSRAREAAMQAAYTARSDEAARFRQEATHVRAEVVRLGEEATGLRAEVARLGEETVGLRADVARLHDEAAQLRDETGALGRRLALAEQTAAALALERDAIHNSTSWRLTRPVRWLRGWLPDRWFRR